MAERSAKIYTRTGDEGYTTLGKNRVSKDDLLVETVGTVDELNSAIGMILTQPMNEEIKACLTQIQHDLFDLGSELHLPEHIAIQVDRVARLEQEIDKWNATLPALKEFILPRGNLAVATCHLARTICRRAERCCVRLHRQVALSNPDMLRYLNRLSDLLFVLARALTSETGEQEIKWQYNKSP